jgi:hypothetical protein
LLFWQPFNIEEGEWPYIFFFSLHEGNLTPNLDFGKPIQEIDKNILKTVSGLEIAN